MKKSTLYRGLSVVFIISSVFIFMGCSKKDNGSNPDENTPEYYISFKANGKQIKYTNSTASTFWYVEQTNIYNAGLLGYLDYSSSSVKNNLIIQLFDNSKISANTYQDPQKAMQTSGAKLPKVLITYADNEGKNYLSLGVLADENGQLPSLPGLENVVADAKVTIKKMTSTYVEGSFSGTTYLNTDASYKTKVVISEGKFILKRNQ